MGWAGTGTLAVGLGGRESEGKASLRHLFSEPAGCGGESLLALEGWTWTDMRWRLLAGLIHL